MEQILTAKLSESALPAGERSVFFVAGMYPESENVKPMGSLKEQL